MKTAAVLMGEPRGGQKKVVLITLVNRLIWSEIKASQSHPTGAKPTTLGQRLLDHIESTLLKCLHIIKNNFIHNTFNIVCHVFRRIYRQSIRESLKWIEFNEYRVDIFIIKCFASKYMSRLLKTIWKPRS